MNPPESVAAPKRTGSKLGLHLFLFAVTLFTTWFAGAGGFGYVELWIASVMGAEVGAYLSAATRDGLFYMGSIMGILLTHEMGHYVMARRNQVNASLPYFIPMPFMLFGTLGAVIIMKGRIRSRNALMEVGAAGPLAGLAVALPVILIGLSLSKVAPIPEAAIIEGQSLLYIFLKWIAVGTIPEGQDVMLHPMAWAGWIGLLVTMLNLLPIGQLDGGHIFYALFGDLHLKVSKLILTGVFLLGLGVMGVSYVEANSLGLEGDAFTTHVLTGMNWVVLGALMLVMFGRKGGKGFQHPPTDDHTLSLKHKITGYACLALFVLTFTPVPIRMVL